MLHSKVSFNKALDILGAVVQVQISIKIARNLHSAAHGDVSMADWRVIELGTTGR